MTDRQHSNVRPPSAYLESAFGVSLEPDLLSRALTHRSYAYENGGLPTNERLEFLGDSVLGVVVTETLYRTHPDSGLHAAAGFIHAGILRDVGDKFGRMLDVVYMQRTLG